MNHFGTGEGTNAAVEMIQEPVVCPKPRRLGLLHATLDEPTNYARPLRCHSSHNQELFDAKAGNELLDIILSKGNYGGVDQSHSPIASSPPFFCGSPPSRVSNPIIQDSRFGDDKFTPPFSPRTIPSLSGLGPSPTSARKPGGCVRENFGNNPAVRVEGFDCLDRDRRNCSIPTLA